MAENSHPEWLEPDPDWPANALASETEAVHEWSGQAETPPQYPGLLSEKDGKLWPIEAKIRENPGAALLVALGAGFLAGTLWKRS
ncbi:MAG TPA: hypothetical protein VFB14_09015 [Bryobacteraceae bacterium]|jgi:hypothetical protein|nr:hypothetical protein [Bryobacteraceae bacterium]